MRPNFYSLFSFSFLLNTCRLAFSSYFLFQIPGVYLLCVFFNIYIYKIFFRWNVALIFKITDVNKWQIEGVLIMEMSRRVLLSINIINRRKERGKTKRLQIYF